MWRGYKAFRPIISSAIVGLVACFEPAQASDSATKCCAELDARLEELASAVLGDTARNVKVQIYGQVNRAILFWKDGIDSKASFVDNNTSSTRLGLIGEGTVQPRLTVGSRFEMEFVWPSSSEIFDPKNVTHEEAFTGYAVRQAYGFISDERFGTLTFGYHLAAEIDDGPVTRCRPLGDTTVYGDLGPYKNFEVGELLSADLMTNKLEVWGTLAQTEVRRRGFGIEQAFDQIGLLVYAQAHFYDLKICGYPCNSNFLPKIYGVNLNEPTVLPTLPWDAFVVGGRAQF